MGFCVGKTARLLGGGAAVLAGFSFLGLQTAASYGLVTVHWDKVDDLFTRAFDTDNSGTVDEKDAESTVRTPRGSALARALEC